MFDRYGKDSLLVDMTCNLRGECCYYSMFHKEEVVKLCKESTHLLDQTYIIPEVYIQVDES